MLSLKMNGETLSGILPEIKLFLKHIAKAMCGNPTGVGTVQLCKKMQRLLTLEERRYRANDIQKTDADLHYNNFVIDPSLDRCVNL